MQEPSMILGMAGVGFFGMLLIGFLAGWIAERAMNRDHGLLTNILVGIAGSFVGGTAASVLGFQWYGFVGNLIVASLGAIGILWFFGKREKTGSRKRSKSRHRGGPDRTMRSDEMASPSTEELNKNLPPIYHTVPEFSEARPAKSEPTVKKAPAKKPGSKTTRKRKT